MSFKQGIVGIIGTIFTGAGGLQAQALEFAKSKLHGLVSERAAKGLGLGVVKGIAAVMGPGMPGTLAQRIAVGTQLAAGIAAQFEEAAASVRAFAVAQAHRETFRTGTASEIAAALEAREAGEERVFTDVEDVSRLLNGQAARPSVAA